MAEHLNGKQRAELFMKGTVTDEKNQTWNVILVPGVENVTKNAGDGWKDSAEAIQTFKHKSFWHSIGDQFKNGFEFSKDVIVDHWIKGIGDDEKEAVQQNQTITNGEIGSGLEHVASWAWFGIKAVGRTVWMPIGTVGGVAYSVTAPVFMVVEKSVLEAALYDAAARGAVVPAILYVWNGFAWTCTSFGNVPVKESYFVHLEYTDQQGQTQQLVIDSQGFKTLVQASVIESMTDDQKQQLQTQINSVDTQIQQVVQPLRKEEQNLQEQQEKAQQKLEASPAQQQFENMYQQAMSSNVTLSSDAKDAYLNQANLRGVVVAYLKSLGVDQPSDDQVNAICKRITDNLEAMHVQMAQQAQQAQQEQKQIQAPAVAPAPATAAPAVVPAPAN